MHKVGFRGCHLVALLAGWLGSAAGLPAAPLVEPPVNILSTAERYLAAAVAGQHSGRTQVRLGHLDKRLRLTKCTTPLQAFQNPGARLSGQTSVAVRCPEESGWTVYVPATIDIFGTALIAARPLSKGAAVRTDDVRASEIRLSQLGQGHIADPDDLQHRVLRRSVPVGTVLTPAMFTSPDLIRRGSRVTLVNTVGPIKVEMLGEAIGDAARGERIRVRALNSGEIVEGWVESASVVKVTL